MLKKLNYALGVVAGTVGSSATELTLKAGHTITTDTGETNKFRAVLFSQDQSTPQEDPNREIVEAYRTGDNTFTISRSQENTSNEEWVEDDHFMLIASAGVYNEYETELNGKANDADVIKKDGSVPFTGNQSLDLNDLEDVNQIDVAGYIELPEDGGATTIIDLPQNTAVDDAEQSYAFKIGGETILKVKALADGAGGIKAESLEVEGGLNLQEGTASRYPLKFQVGVNLTTPQVGVVEFDGDDLYITTN